MKKSLIVSLMLALALLFTVACNKEDKARLADLQNQTAELEGTVADLPEMPELSPQDLSISLDNDCYWVDGAGSVTVHYTLSKPASLDVVAEDGWHAEVSPSGETEGDITVTAPDPASPTVLTVKTTDGKGNTAENFAQIFVRKQYGKVPNPRIDAMAYFGFTDELATDYHFQKLVEAGITMLCVEGDWEPWQEWRNQCVLAEKYGIKVVLFIGGTAGSYSADPDNYKGLDEKVLEAETYPAVCAYQIADEPSTAKAWSLSIARERIGELAPGHPTYINLHPSGVSQDALGALTYEDYVEFFATICNLEFITFDQYPVYEWGVEDNWFHSLDVVSSTAKRHNIPFWAFLLCCEEQLRAFPTLENIRLQGNIDIAYGAQCIQYFVWKNTSGTDYAPVMSNGEYKPVYYDCKEYNREMHNREFVFAGSYVHKVRHIGLNYYLHGECLTDTDLPEAISEITADGSALVSFVGNAGNEYVVICNKSWEEKLPVTVNFTREVYTIDREGEFAQHQPGTAGFTIDEGDMLVVKYR